MQDVIAIFFQGLFKVPDGKTFWEVFSDECEQFKLLTKDMSENQMFILCAEPGKKTIEYDPLRRIRRVIAFFVIPTVAEECHFNPTRLCLLVDSRRLYHAYIYGLYKTYSTYRYKFGHPNKRIIFRIEASAFGRNRRSGRDEIHHRSKREKSARQGNELQLIYNTPTHIFFYYFCNRKTQVRY